MSTTIDKKVVEMRFDNSQFESNVKTSLNTLDKLKEKLHFTDAGKGLESINQAAKNVDMNGLADGVEAVKVKFSALQVIAATALANITTSVMNTASKVGSALNEAIWGGGKRRAMNLEQANFQLMGLLKDEQAVADIMQNVNDSVDGTAYSLDAAAMVASQFAASGMRGGEEMFHSLRAVAGVAAMTNSEYSDIGRVFTTVAGNGRLMGDQLLQLSSRGLNAAAAVAEYLGTTEGEVRELVSKGQISFEIFANAMDSAFGEHAKEANRTFTGAMSNIKSALARIGALFIAPLIAQDGPMVQFFNTLRLFVNSIKSFVPPIANMVTSFIINIVNAVNNLVASIPEAKIMVFMTGMHSVASAILNILKALGSVLKPIGQAFLNVFKPSVTSFSAAARSLEGFTSKLILSEKSSESLRKVFEGLFTVLKVFVSVIKLALTILKPFALIAVGIAKVIFTIIGYIGGLISKLGIISTITDAISNAINIAIAFVQDKLAKLSAFLSPFIEKLKSIFSIVAQKVKFAGLTALSAVFQGILFLGDKLKVAFGYIKEAIADFSNSQIAADLKGIWESIKSIGNTVGEYLVGAFEKAKASIGPIKDTIATVVEKIKEFFAGVKEQAETKGLDVIHTVLSGIKAVLDDVGGALSNMKSKAADAFSGLGEKLKNSGILEFLKSVWEFVKDLAGTIGSALGEALSSIFGGLSNANFEGALNLAKSGGIVAIALAIKDFIETLSDPIKSVGDVMTGVSDFATNINDIFVAVKDTFAAFQENLKANKLSIIAGAIALLTASVVALSLIDTDKLYQSLFALIFMMEELKNIMNSLKATKDSKSAAAELMALGAAVLVLSIAMKSIGKLDPEELAKGLIGITLLTTMLTRVTKQLSGKNDMAKGLGGLVSMAISIGLLAGALKELGRMDIKNLAKGLGALGVLFAELSVFMAIMDNMDKDTKSKVGGLMGMAAAMLVFAGVLKILGSMTLEQTAIALAAMGGALIELALAMKYMEGFKSGVGGLLAAAAAIAILAPALKLLGTMDLKQVGTALLALAGAFVVIGVAGAVLGTISGFILAFGAALALIGVSVLAVGAGVLMLAQGFALLVATMALVGSAGTLVTSALANTAKSLIEIVANAIPLLAQKIAEGIVVIMNTLLSNSANIATTFVTILDQILQTLADHLPNILRNVGKILGGVLSVLRRYTPQIVNTAIGMLLAVLKGLADNMERIVTVATDLVLNFLTGIENNLPRVFQKGADLLIAFIDGITQAIENNKDRLAESLKNLFLAIVDAVITLLGAAVETFKEAGKKIMNTGFIQGIKDKFVALWNAIKTMMVNAVAKIKEKFNDWKEAGKNLIANVINGIHDKITAIKNKISEVIQAARDKITEWWENFKSAGSGLIQGVISGFQDKVEAIKTKIHTIIQAVRDKITAWWENFKNAGKGLITAVSDGFHAKWDALVTKIKTIIQSVRDKIKEYWEDFKSAGKYLVNGLKEGISDSSAIATLVATSASTALKAYNAAKKVLKINSPSKIMIPLGRGIDEGLALGIDKGASLVEDSSTDAALMAVDGVKSTLARMSEAITDGIDTEPVIRPVLDLSDVTNGAKTINAMFSSNRALSVGAIGELLGITNESQNGQTINFTQNNYSPKALSRIDIYRQTRSQFSTFSRNMGRVS